MSRVTESDLRAVHEAEVQILRKKIRDLEERNARGVSIPPFVPVGAVVEKVLRKIEDVLNDVKTLRDSISVEPLTDKGANHERGTHPITQH